MKIKELYFRNKAHRWELERTGFSDLTLLVGASGVGKTRISDSIVKLVNISYGYAYNGVVWDLRFNAENGKDYKWTGEFESIEAIEQKELKEKDISGRGNGKQSPRLVDEKLYLEDELVFEREIDTVKYERKEVPKISPYKSVLSFFTEEEKVSPVKKAFGKIVFHDYHKEKKHKIPTATLRSIIGYMDDRPSHF